jgi:hypothetical protein
MVPATLPFAYLAMKVETGAPIRKDFCFHLDDELVVKGWLGTRKLYIKSKWLVRPGLPLVGNVLALSLGRRNPCGIICTESGRHQRYYPQATS